MRVYAAFRPWFLSSLQTSSTILSGWDNTGTNGANLSFPEEFGIADRPWLIGVINSAPSLFGLLSAWAVDPVNNFFGRRGNIFVTGLFVVFPVLAQGFTQDWVGLMICRLFMGLGMGIKISTIPIYSAEVSPANIRGGIVTSFQLWVAFGILLGFSTNLIFMDVGRLAWRFRLSAAFVPAMPLLLMAESEDSKGKSLSKRVMELFTVPRIRRATVSSSVIVIAQQFSGINIMAFYSSTIFSEAGYSVKQSLLASFGFVGYSAGLWAKIPLIALFVFLFGAFYGPGIGPITSIYFSESFPLSHREIGAALTICVNNSFSSALGLTFPSLLAKITPTGAFCSYAGLNMLSFVVIFFVVPETKRRTLEELDESMDSGELADSAYN
ncbi:hypothetical protein D6D21_06568 [Aureobasidium pullulans]|uniref:Major facilitator superfamily (MFS) profile domain-containing protein n=1 Tax=Aureobasidium pullulans TaxID=5580 RepID=A0A4S8XAK1_AURPU|nr:hypothetical protein D6D22_07612 [Aureobasidium pullulans]THW40911.1 hypothetical protein D6D21_06568 [Aureobasidium pullulans]